jgi:hypothetical protein
MVHSKKFNEYHLHYFIFRSKFHFSLTNAIIFFLFRYTKIEDTNKYEEKRKIKFDLGKNNCLTFIDIQIIF